jgi:hypothetical protein
MKGFSQHVKHTKLRLDFTAVVFSLIQCGKDIYYEVPAPESCACIESTSFEVRRIFGDGKGPA